MSKQQRRACIALSAGDYLKLWESEEEQLAHIKSAIVAGQIYNHWGRNDGLEGIELDPKVVADRLALRASYDVAQPTPVPVDPPAAPRSLAARLGSDSQIAAASANVGDMPRPDPSAVGLSSKEVRMAERQYTRAVMAGAGASEMTEILTASKKKQKPQEAPSKRPIVQQQLLAKMKRRKA